MIKKDIIFFSQKATLACDAQCHKAWGINERPRKDLSGDPDDYVYLSDSDLENAPEDSSWTEGGYGKPTSEDERLNKWCARQCERSYISNPGEWAKEPILPDMENPKPNIGKR